MPMSEFNNLHSHYVHHFPIEPGSPRYGNLVPYSDTVLHLPVLQYFASLCDHVTEFGTRDGHSTLAFLAGVGDKSAASVGKGHVVSYDIDRTTIVGRLQNMTLPCSWTFHQKSTLDVVIENTDMIFFDTLHTYEHLSKELKLHGRKARKFLAFHDTHTCGVHDLSGANPSAIGIMPAILEFLLEHHGKYKKVYETKWNNGLLILERIA